VSQASLSARSENTAASLQARHLHNGRYPSVLRPPSPTVLSCRVLVLLCSLPPSRLDADRLSLAMQAANEQAEKQKLATPKPKKPKKEEVKVIGSGCTWRRTELDHFKVALDRDVDVRDMIPQRFFEFENLEGYAECTFPGCVDG